MRKIMPLKNSTGFKYYFPSISTRSKITPIINCILSFLFYSTTIAEVEESFSQFSYNDMGGSVLTNPSLNSKNSIPLQTE